MPVEKGNEGDGWGIERIFGGVLALQPHARGGMVAVEPCVPHPVTDFLNSFVSSGLLQALHQSGDVEKAFHREIRHNAQFFRGFLISIHPHGLESE